MAISIVGTPQYGSSNNGGNVTLTFDGTPATGDCCLLFQMISRDSIGNGTLSDPSTSGYTRLIDYSESQVQSFAVFYKFMGATPDTSVTALGNGSARTATCAASYMLRGVDAAVLDTAAVLNGPNTVSNDPDPPSVTTVTNGAWVFAAASMRGSNDSAWDAISGYSGHVAIYQVDTASGAMSVSYKAITTAGSENPGAYANWFQIGSSSWIAYSIAIRPAGSGGISHPLYSLLIQPSINRSLIR